MGGQRKRERQRMKERERKRREEVEGTGAIDPSSAFNHFEFSRLTGLKSLTGTEDDTFRWHLNNLDGLSYIIIP